MSYTMGSALTRAIEHGVQVEVLADGEWVSGLVVVNDGVGVVLDNGNEHVIVKLDRIAAVRVLADIEWKDVKTRIPSQPSARPMPAQ